MEFKKTGRAVALLGAVLVGGTACQDLQVPNTNNADRARATSNPQDIQAFIGGAIFPGIWDGIHEDEDVQAAWPAASELIGTMQGQNTDLQFDEFAEPRSSHDNGIVLSQGNGPQGARDFWAQITQTASVPFDGLQVLDSGVEIIVNGVNLTPQARAFAKFTQGWTWGYMGLIFDEAHVLSETTTLPSAPDALLETTLESLEAYPEVISSAVTSLEEAVAVAQANPGVVNYPSINESALWFGATEPVSNSKFIGIASTMAARLIVLSARTPADRAALDWNKVLQLTANGLNEGHGDYLFQLNAQRESDLLIEAQSNEPTSERNLRWDYRAIGPADQSGAYQDWISASLANRDRFDILTPDPRITVPLQPQTDGAYTRYREDDNGFIRDRGSYLYAAYQWTRHMNELGPGFESDEDLGEDDGSHPLITVDENNLLRAEALLRTGDAAGAAELINVSRTRSHTIDGVEYPGLPPVTAAGVPTDGNDHCVPRQDDGDCGTLLDAIRYERMVELAVTDAVRGYAEMRGWGTLPDGSLLHWPVPGNVLDLYGLPGYTYGGVGGEASATYGPVSNP
ncbi:MAG: RagB/SusD family nutrient uptake outer membrane protein [Gemmatimonadota bacterium]